MDHCGKCLLCDRGGEAGMVEKTNFIKVNDGKSIRLKNSGLTKTLEFMWLSVGSVTSTMLDRRSHLFLKGGLT